MKRFILATLGILFLVACSDDRNLMIVQGDVDGLKKGTIYLQKYDGEKLVNLDSVVSEGSGKFHFEYPIESPEVFYLYLDLNKKEGTDFGDRLMFFGEKGVITINSRYEMFDINAKISGSESQKILDEYNKTMRKFSSRNIDLLELQVNAMKQGQTEKADSIRQVSEKNLLRRYLFALNFAMNHPDSYVAPYIALTDTYNANVKILDSLYGKLAPEVAESKYGKEFKKYLEDIKAKEKE